MRWPCLSAVPGTKTEEGRQEAALLRSWYQSAKSFLLVFSQSLANAVNRKFHFMLNHYNLAQFSLT